MKGRPALPGFLQTAPAAMRTEFLTAARSAEIPPGSPLLSPGQYCAGVAFLTAGRVRVYQVGEEGREVTLYHLGPGECCVLTVACLLGGQPFPALARTETDVRAWSVTAVDFRGWVDRHQFWRDYVFSLLGRRLGEVLHRVEDVAFRRIDVRLAAALLRRAGSTGRYVTVTQQQLADELGTAREVVSRTLARLRSDGLVRVARGRIEVLDRAGLVAVRGRS
jgi:CRP/FNR family transcriptional regulator, anaerobic regulatory protein